jgi:hypothetical protein
VCVYVCVRVCVCVCVYGEGGVLAGVWVGVGLAISTHTIAVNDTYPSSR